MNQADHTIKALLRRPEIWRGSHVVSQDRGALTTGFAALDALLPGGGWPLGALTEILVTREGIGELRLVMPALVRLSREKRYLAWIAPPHLPYAPALSAFGVELSRMLLIRPAAGGNARKERLWAAEQTMRSGACGAVLAWLSTEEDRSLRRLQLAAEIGRCWGVLFGPKQAAGRPSPAALRLLLEADPDGLAVQVFKCRGGWPRQQSILLRTKAVANRHSSRNALALYPSPSPLSGGLLTG
jgi:hypothetical protein